MPTESLLAVNRRIRILDHVFDERVRQEVLREQGRFPFTAANTGLKNVERLPMLTEELGEVAKQVQQQPDSGLMPVDLADRFDWRRAGDHEFDPEAGTLVGLRKELVQTAAIAVAWIEALDCADGEPWKPVSDPEAETPAPATD